MSLIDLSIIKSQLQNQTLSKSITDNISFYSANKRSFMRPLGIMNVVYTSTYCTANLTEYICKKNSIDYKLPTLLTTSAVNIMTIMYKDKMYSQMLKKSSASFPLSSSILFGVRDMATIMTCFIWKKDLIVYLDKYMAHNKSDILASIFMPSAIQIVSTPIHILAIDLYEHPDHSFKERLQRVPAMYKSILLGRVMRAFPAFGIGGFINDMIRPIRD